MSENKYEKKPGLVYISERNNQWRYSDVNGDMQWIQPLSRYKAFTEIKRGEAVSIVTKDDLFVKAKSDNCIDTIRRVFTFQKNDEETTSKIETLNDNVAYPTYIKEVYRLSGEDSNTLGTEYVLVEERYYQNVIGSDGTVSKNLTRTVKTIYSDYNSLKKATLPLTITKTDDYVNQHYFDKDEWNKDQIVYTVSLKSDVDNYQIIRTIDAYSKTKVDIVLSDPDPYVIKTDSAVHKRTVGLALEYASGYGDIIHVQSYGKFTFEPEYEGKNVNFYGADNPNHTEFDHIGKEYNPCFTYDDVGKQVYIAYKEMDGSAGHLTVDEEAVSKYYHNIICLGFLADAPAKDTTGNTVIEINISGDQRGLLEATQFEARLGEDVPISSEDPIRVFAVGKETDTTFKARLCFTPQGGSFTKDDFIAFQKMDGNTAILYFNNSFDVDGVTDDDDLAFLHMAKCYASLSENKNIGTYQVSLNDTQTSAAVQSNISQLYKDTTLNVLSDLFERVSGFGLNIKTYISPSEYYGYIDMEAKKPGGYFVMYVSSGLKSKFDGSITECHGSFENRGLAVLADVRVPERREVLGVYYGSKWNTVLEKGYTTVFMRLGEFDVPETSKQFDGDFKAGQEYYLGTNGRVTKFPYNQYDFVNKVGFIKYSNTDDLRFVVDIGSSTRRYNGDLPVGYMKPAVHSGTNYTAEYGFLLMDGKTIYSKDKPYDAIYERLLGWFDRNDVDVAGTDKFKVPAVSRMIPDEVTETDTEGHVTVTTKQVQVPMQIKFLATGIYEEMPRIPFKRFFGIFNEDNIRENDDWTPVKPCVEDCDITDIIDYGISEDGYTKPGLDNLDIHLFIDPNENYISGAHDWHEVHEGYFNWNNSTTFGYTWKIIEEDATDLHPYGVYKLHMETGNSQGVAYVTDNNQAPKKLNGCYYKLYVARREVFSRQFDIEKIYKDYLTNSVWTDEAKSSVVLTKACTGKAVIDAIENRYNIKTLVGNKGATVKFGEIGNPVGSLVLDTSSDLPIIASLGVSIQNSEDNMALDESQRSSKVTFKDGVLAKNGAYDDTPVLNVDPATNDFTVKGNVIPTVKQIRDHATATIDNRPFAKYYADKDNKTGLIHGMIFGKDGNVNASTLWELEPMVSSGESIDSVVHTAAFIPVSYKSNTGWETVVEGTTVYRDNSGSVNSVISTEMVHKSSVSNYVLSDGSPANITTNGSGLDSVEKIIDSKFGSMAKSYKLNGIRKALTVLDLENGILKLLKVDNGASGSPTVSNGLAIYAGQYLTASRSEMKRIYGELIRDDSLVSDKDLVEGSKKYDETVIDKTNPSTLYPEIEYQIEKSTNKFHTILGSALQAAYEMPLAYWQYNTEKEWYKDRIGVIVQRIESVAKNIKGKKYATATIGSLIATSTSYEDKNISIVLTRQGKTDNVKVDTLLNNSVVATCTGDKVGDIKSNEFVVFSGVKDAKLLIADEDFMAENPYTVALDNGVESGTERKLFDKLYDINGDDTTTTTISTKASVTLGNLIVTAKKAGKDGNSLAVDITYTQDDQHYVISVYKDNKKVSSYKGKDIAELHTIDSTDDSPVKADDAYVDFTRLEDSDGSLSEFTKKVYLNGGEDGEAISKNLVNTDYKENTYQYTSEEADSIKEYMTTIIDNSSNGQDLISTVGMLLKAAKETQERLLRVEASTFGRDYETIPGNHKPYVLSGMQGVVPDPTNYGLNRLIRAICQELYYDSNPFDEALANGGDVNIDSLSRIDRLDREIHGKINTEDGVKTAPNVIESIDSTTYPYEDMIRAVDDTNIREAEFTMENYDDLAKSRGTGVRTRVNMSLFGKDSDGNYTNELDTNVNKDDSHFNGIVDAIYRITTKLNALTESINNSDNIADSPKRLNTIRQNIEHIIREAYFDDTYNITEGELSKGTSTSGKETEIINDFTKVDPNPYHDVNGPENAPYQKNVSRFDKITSRLYDYVISVSGESLANFGGFNEFGDEKVISQIPVRDPETGEVKLVDTETQVYYAGRKFNGKRLLVDNKPVATDGKDLDGTDVAYSAKIHTPQNLNDYNYATLIDIVVDAIGSEWFRKQVSYKNDKDLAHNNIEELRHNKTISERLDSIETCLDKIVGKLSREHSFEQESSIYNNNNSDNKVQEASDQTVFSIDRYLQFLNEYLGYNQTTNNNPKYGAKDYHESDTEPYTTAYTEHWANGIDYDIEGHSSKIDGNPKDVDFVANYGQSIGQTEYSAEWAFKNKKNIHAGLVNTLARLQNEEARSTNLDAILGDDFKSTLKNVITTRYDEFNGGETSVKAQTATANYTLTDDIADLLKTIYGKDNHNRLQENNKGSFTSYEHRTLITSDGNKESTNTNTRFVAGDFGNNIVDAIVNELYMLPRPVRPFSVELDKIESDSVSKYLKESQANNVVHTTNNNLFVPTDNTIEAHDSANGAELRDSRLATYYDFEDGKNYYDVPESEYALSWDNRCEFFNDLGRTPFTDNELVTGKNHYRLSRFEVLENEIRHLRKLIGLDFGNWNGEKDLVDLKFNGVLQFFGDRVNNGFSGNPFGKDNGSGDVNSFTDQFNVGADNDKSPKTTNMLRFMLNADKSERLLRAELGFSDPSWAKEVIGTKSGYDFWYDYTYSTAGKETLETLSSSNIVDGANTYSMYGVFGQQTDVTYKNRHSVYDRILALEQNAVRVDAWLDSVKNSYRPSVGKGVGKGNIYDIVDYLGNYTWDSDDNHYYGSFGDLDKINIRISDKDVSNRFDTVTSEINEHHSALINIYDIIGIDANADDAEFFVKTGPDTTAREVLKKNTLWARLNAVEILNKNDVDLTNVVTSASVGLDATGYKETTLPERVMDETERLVTTLDSFIANEAELVASKGYVDNAINNALNNALYEFRSKTSGQFIVSEVSINGTIVTDIADGKQPTLNNEQVTDNNDIVLETTCDTDKIEHFDAVTTQKLLKAINLVNGQTQSDVNTLYKNLSGLMAALNYTYNESIVNSTTGPLLEEVTA